MSAPSSSDDAALRDLVHRYAAYADERELDQLADLFATDGVLSTPGGTHQGREAIRAHLAVLERLDGTHHLVAGEVFDIDAEGEARGRVTAEAHHFSGGNDHVWHLVYRDTYLKSEGVWLFARRVIDLRATDDRPITRP